MISCLHLDEELLSDARMFLRDSSERDMLRYVFLSLYAERLLHCLRDMYLIFCCQVLQRTSKKFVEVVDSSNTTTTSSTPFSLSFRQTTVKVQSTRDPLI